MMAQTGARRETAGSGWRLGLLVALFAAELLALSALYQFGAQMACHETGAVAFCRGLRSLVARALAVMAVGVVLAWARPALARRLVALTSARSGGALWAVVHFAGVALLILPLVLAAGRDMTPMFAQLAPFWAAGALLAAAGGLMWLAAPATWRAIGGAEARVILLALGGAVLIPDLADLILPLWWHWPELTAATFRSVAWVLALGRGDVFVDAPAYIVGVGGFRVHIAQQCSGVEGLALVTGFTALYAMLFRDQIRVPQYWLVVLPLALLASWSLNVLRIAALIVIGDRISPDLAVNGFHSYAGWLFFILLALGLMWSVHAVPWLHRAETRTAPAEPLRSDWTAARILPFAVFMVASLVTAAFFFHPELGYPLKAVAMCGALAFFWPALRGRDWAPGGVAVGAGAVVGLVWVLTAPADSADAFVLSQLLTGLSAGGLTVWILARVVGTVALVPLIEELFFRGYLLARLDGPGPLRRALALGLSSLAFGLMHGRVVEAVAAGLVFGGLMLWRGRLADALWAHVAANAVVAAVAAARGDWALI